MRYAAKRDESESAIVEALRGIGATVHRLDATGVPDLLVGIRGETILMECKTGNGQLTDAQASFLQGWNGSHVFIVRGIDDAIKAVMEVTMTEADHIDQLMHDLAAQNDTVLSQLTKDFDLDGLLESL